MFRGPLFERRAWNGGGLEDCVADDGSGGDRCTYPTLRVTLFRRGWKYHPAWVV